MSEDRPKSSNPFDPEVAKVTPPSVDPVADPTTGGGPPDPERSVDAATSVTPPSVDPVADPTTGGGPPDPERSVDTATSVTPPQADSATSVTPPQADAATSVADAATSVPAQPVQPPAATDSGTAVTPTANDGWTAVAPPPPPAPAAPPAPQWNAAGADVVAPPPPPPPGWGSSPAGGTVPVKANLSNRALAVLILAITSFVLCPVIPAIAALVMAGGADREIDESNGYLTGRGMVTGGRILAWVNIALTVIVTVVLFGLILWGLNGDFGNEIVDTETPQFGV